MYSMSVYENSVSAVLRSNNILGVTETSAVSRHQKTAVRLRVCLAVYYSRLVFNFI